LQYLDCHDGRCVNCNICVGIDLTFLHVEAARSCAICLDDKRRFVFHPGGCGHSFCCDCFARFYCRWKNGAYAPDNVDALDIEVLTTKEEEVSTSGEEGSDIVDEDPASSSADENEGDGGWCTPRQACPLCRAPGVIPSWLGRRLGLAGLPLPGPE
jgi:hypothetical protein